MIVSVGFPQNRFLMPALKSMSEAMAVINNNDFKKARNPLLYDELQDPGE